MARKQQRRKPRFSVNGWLVLDKPLNLTSNDALSQLKRIFHPEKVGHAGTLDPLATGCLPIAFGEATKTVPFVMDGRKVYRFEVTWGTQTTTDDAEASRLKPPMFVRRLTRLLRFCRNLADLSSKRLRFSQQSKWTVTVRTIWHAAART